MLTASVCLSQLVVKKQTAKNGKTKGDRNDFFKNFKCIQSIAWNEKDLFPDVNIKHGCAKVLLVRLQCSPVIT